MENFVKLTIIVSIPTPQGEREAKIKRPIHLRKEAIVSVYPQEDGTVVAFSTGYSIIVQEKAEDILEMLK